MILRQTTILLSVCACLLAGVWLSPIPLGRAMPDFLFVLDGAYRIELGQLPHADFASPIGALTLYMTSLAIWLFPHGNAFVGLHVMAWLMAIVPFAALAPRFSSNRAFFAALALLAAIVLVPVTVDRTILAEISYFATYNRFATGLLFIAGLWLVLPKRRHDWLLLAYLLTALFFLKVTTAIVLLGVVAGAVVLGRCGIRQALAAFAAFLVAVSAVEMLTGGLVSGYFNDILAMSRVNRGWALHAVFYAGYRNWTVLLASVVLALFVLAAGLSGSRFSLRAWWGSFVSIWRRDAFILDAALLVAAALLAESQNSGGLGLIAAAAVFFHPAAWRWPAPRAALTALLLAAMILPVLDTGFSRMLTVVVREARPTVRGAVDEMFAGTTVPPAVVAGARLFRRINTEWPDFAHGVEVDGFSLEKDPGSNAQAGMLAWIVSAVEAGRIFGERNYGAQSQRYATLGFVDPFARMLRLTPALHTALVMDIGRTVPLFTPQEAEAYLKTADGVFVALCERRSLQSNAAAFHTVLDRQFERLPLNACWEFYRRTSGPD